MARASAAAPVLYLPPRWRVARDATIDQLCDLFLERCRAEQLSPATVRSYDQGLKHFRAWCQRHDRAYQWVGITTGQDQADGQAGGS